MLYETNVFFLSTLLSRGPCPLSEGTGSSVQSATSGGVRGRSVDSESRQTQANMTTSC
jgi:hypothetical protein